MAVTNLGSFSNNANPSTGISGNNTANAIAAGDKVVATLYIPNSNPTSVSVTIGGTAMTEIATSRSTRSNKTIVSFYLDAASAIASGSAIVASWTNTGTQNGGGALIVLGALTPTNAFASGAPDVLHVANGLSTTPSTGATATPSDATADYFAWAALGVINNATGLEAADNTYTALTQAANTVRNLLLDAAAKEFTAPPVAAQTETWTTTWGGTNHDWVAAILLFRETVPSAPTNTVAPAVTGTPAVGSTLSTTDGTWTGTPTSFTYQWKRDVGTSGATWLAIAGATANSYVVAAEDLGSAIRCEVVATNANGSSSPSPSNATSSVPAPAGQLTFRVVSGPQAGSDNQVHSSTLALPVLPGDLMVLFAACSNANLVDANGNQSDIGTVTDTGSHTWVQDSEAFSDTNIQHSAQAFSAQSPAGLAYASTVTMTVHGGVGVGGYHGQSPYWFIVAISTGDNRRLRFDSQDHDVDLLTSHTAPSVTTQRPVAVVFGFHTGSNMGAAGWWTPTTGFTELADTAPALGNGGETDYGISGEAQAVSTGYTGGAGGTTASNKTVTNLVVAYSVAGGVIAAPAARRNALVIR